MPLSELQTIEIRKTWTYWSEVLNFRFISPCFIEYEGRTIEFFAYLPDIGRKGGMFIEVISPPDFNTNKELWEISKQLGRYMSAINFEVYHNADRDKICEALIDWGFYGDDNYRPSCFGAPRLPGPVILKEDVIEQLSKDLLLPHAGKKQDWEIEMVNSNWINDFLKFYRENELSIDKKIAVMYLLIASYDNFLKESHIEIDDRWEQIKSLLKSDRAIFVELIDYCSLKNEVDQDNFFRVTPLMRAVK